jgi:TonB family protein
MRLRLAAFSVLLIASSLGEVALAGRAPTRGWVVNFDDAQCVAFREYGSAQNPIQLNLKVQAIGGVVQVAISRKGTSILANQVKGTLTIDGRPPVRISMLAYSPAGSGLRVHSMNLPAAEFDFVRQAKQISVTADGLDDSFALSGMAPMLKAIDDCVLDLRRVFNITDAQAGETSSLKRRTRANIGRLITSKDYPRDALDRSQDGRVKFVLLVNEKGRVADCTVIETSGVAVLDAQSCILLKERARFQPALGADGKPAKDAVTAAIVWSVAW